MLIHTIYRRLFNPSTPDAKDIRTIVGKFSDSALAEANACLKMLQDKSTRFDKVEHPFDRYRYTLHSEPIKAKNREELAALQLDVDKCRPTKRPIVYEYTWHPSKTAPDQCDMLVYHALYGSIRATVPDNVESRQFFLRAIKRVWPNAEMKKK